MTMKPESEGLQVAPDAGGEVQPAPIRQKFEEWAFLYDYDTTRSTCGSRSGLYASEATQRAWNAWQHFAREATQPSTTPAPQAGSLERTPTDYALEFAGYLATGALQLLTALDAAAAAQMALDDEIDPDDEAAWAAGTHALEDARETVDEFMRGLRENVYEFGKRRDRALATPPAVAVEPPPPMTEDELLAIARAVPTFDSGEVCEEEIAAAVQAARDAQWLACVKGA